LCTNYFLVPYTLAAAVGANLGTFGDGDGTTTAPFGTLLGA
jgi:hypothetical protein